MVSACTALEYSCWAISIVLVIVLVVLGCTEMGKGPGGGSYHGKKAARFAKNAESNKKSAKYSYSAPDDGSDRHFQENALDGRENNKKVDELGSAVEGAFASYEPNDRERASSNGMPLSWQSDETRAALKQQQSDDGLFQWEHADDADMKPISKEGAARGANTLATAHMETSRSAHGSLSRTVGLNPNAGLRPALAARPMGGKCVSFMDADGRQQLFNKATNCLDSESCPWQKQ